MRSDNIVQLYRNGRFEQSVVIPFVGVSLSILTLEGWDNYEYRIANLGRWMLMADFVGTEEP